MDIEQVVAIFVSRAFLTQDTDDLRDFLLLARGTQGLGGREKTQIEILLAGINAGRREDAELGGDPVLYASVRQWLLRLFGRNQDSSRTLPFDGRASNVATMGVLSTTADPELVPPDAAARLTMTAQELFDSV